MEILEKDILAALSKVADPDKNQDIISLGAVSALKIEGKNVSFKVAIGNAAMHAKKRMIEACEFAINRTVSGDIKVNCEIEVMKKPEEIENPTNNKLPNIKNFVAVASGKGGVGKSTMTANIAVALAKEGYKVGLVDADIYGPSMPLMFDVQQEKPQGREVDGKQKIVPVESYGVKMLSIGFFADVNQAVIWRGPMATKALQQMIFDADWGELDYLLIDLPPGTGDIHLTLVQALPLTGAVIVSTPQNIALADARKGVNMFKLDTINVPVLGIIENMAWFTPEELPDNKYFIFGKEGAKDLADQLQVPLLGQIPLVQSIRESGDIGRPAVLQESTPVALALKETAKNIVKQVEWTKKNVDPTKIVEVQTEKAGCST
jgi:ATP-binding protein involved in chromosome partitioning